MIRVYLIFILLLGLTKAELFAQILSKDELQKKTLYRNFSTDKAQIKQVYRMLVENGGKIPDNIADYQHLQSLQLMGNDWDYNLDVLPEGFYQLYNLCEFALHNTNVSEISPKIAQLKNLESLQIGTNRLIDLPEELSKLPKLTKLAIPQNIKKLPLLSNLEELTITVFDDKAEIPLGMDKLLNLRKLSINGWGSLNLASLFKVLRTLPKLQHLKISMDVNEEAAQELKNLTNLQSLDLQNFSGKAKWLSFLVNLQTLTIQSFYTLETELQNYLSVIAQLPFLNHFATTFHRQDIAGYQKFKKLELFFGDNEHFSPQDVDNLLSVKGLYKLNLREFPPNLGKLKNVQTINLLAFRYRLTGLFISQLAQINSLQNLILSTSNFEEVSAELTQLNQLKQLEIYDYGQVLQANDKAKIQQLLPQCQIKFVP